MITLPEAKTLASECDERLKGAFFKTVSSVGEKQWVLEFDQPKKRVRLLVCMKKPLSRFHLTEAPYKKVTSPWTGRVQKYLEGATLETCALLGDDRILELTLSRGDTVHYLLFELFASQAFLLDAARNIVASTPKRKEGLYSPPPRSFEPERLEAACTSVAIEKLYLEKEEEEALIDKKGKIERALQKKIKRAEGQIARMLETLKEANTWEEKEHLAQLLKAHFGQIKRGMTKIELPDWKEEGKTLEITLDPSQLPKDQIDRFFKKARKLKKGVPHAESMLGRREEELIDLQGELQKLATLETAEELETFSLAHKLFPPAPPKRERAEPKKRLPYRTFTTEAGMIIRTGKSDKDGDILTFTVANGNDWWFHVANYPGSHVVLKCPKGTEPDHESLKDAALLALYFSKAKKGGGDDITVTQVKHVGKSRGAKAGLVSVSRHKKVYCRMDKMRLDQLFGRGEKK